VAITRIKFNDSAVDAGAYTVPLNPISVDLKDNKEANVIAPLDGGVVFQNKYFDSRPLMLEWVNIPNDYLNIPTLLNTVSGYYGSVKYVHFGSIDKRYVAATGWTKVRVGPLRVTEEAPRSGGGGKIFHSITLLLYPEP